MYNRYIPQPDGSYRRNRMPEQCRPAPPPPCPKPSQPQPKPPCDVPAQPPRPPKKDSPCPQRSGANAGSFLRQLLPKDLDTGDLIVILLLLLMAGDCQEDQNTALLTLALYLFM